MIKSNVTLNVVKDEFNYFTEKTKKIQYILCGSYCKLIFRLDSKVVKKKELKQYLFNNFPKCYITEKYVCVVIASVCIKMCCFVIY